MIRGELAKQLDHDPNFRWRGEAVTRIENLSDIVFALALGMLVSVSDPPTRYVELSPYLLNIIPVTAAFAILLTVWNAHFTYFRRYGVADSYIIFLNAALLLFVLFIAYPLRFAFDSLFGWILGASLGQWEWMGDIGISHYREAGVIVAWFGAGMALIFFLIHLMYSYALRRANTLGLDPAEQAMTRRSIWRYRVEFLLYAIVAVLAGFTLLGPMAAMISILNWPAAIIIDKRIPLQTPEK